MKQIILCSLMIFVGAFSLHAEDNQEPNQKNQTPQVQQVPDEAQEWERVVDKLLNHPHIGNRIAVATLAGGVLTRKIKAPYAIAFGYLAWRNCPEITVAITKDLVNVSKPWLKFGKDKAEKALCWLITEFRKDAEAPAPQKLDEKNSSNGTN